MTTTDPIDREALREKHRPTDADRRNAAGYPTGPVAYFEFIDGWRRVGEFEGPEFRSPSP